MQLKCTYCSTPFALSNDQVAAAIETLKDDPQGHFDAHCPKCRRANKLPRKAFERFPHYRRMLEGLEPVPAVTPIAEAVEAPGAEPGGAGQEPAGKAASEPGRKRHPSRHAVEEPPKKPAAKKKRPAGK